jgi:hypothetical protein
MALTAGVKATSLEGRGMAGPSGADGRQDAAGANNIDMRMPLCHVEPFATVRDRFVI